MKRIIALFIVLMVGSIVFCQELTSTHHNKVDAQGRRQGFWKVFDVEGNLKFEGNFIDGIPTGTFKYYYPSGTLKASVINSDSGKVSYTDMFHPDGKKLATGKYINQVKDSTWLYFSGEDGSLAAEEHYVAGKKEGIWKTYYPSGQVAEETIYKNDLKEGPWMQYFTDGKIKSKAVYIADKLEGLIVIYHVNGNIQVSGSFVHSLKEGTWVYLNDLGELEKKEEYVKGNLVRPKDQDEER